MALPLRKKEKRNFCGYEPKNLTLRGFSIRRLRRVDRGLNFYQTGVAEDGENTESHGKPKTPPFSQ